MLRKVLIINETNTADKNLYTELSTFFDVSRAQTAKEITIKLSLNYKVFSAIIICTDKIQDFIDETILKIVSNPMCAIIPLIILDTDNGIESNGETVAETEYHYLNLGVSNYLCMDKSSKIIAKHISNLINLCDKTSHYKNYHKKNATLAQMNAIMANIQSGITAVSLVKQPYEILFSNDKFYEIIDCTKDTYATIATNEFECICPQDKDRILKKVKEMQLHTELTLEYQIVQFSGTQIWVRHHLSFLNISELGGIVRLGIMEDITAEKDAAEKVSLTQECLSPTPNEFLGDLATAVCVCEPKTYKLLYINKACETLFGKTISENKEQYCYALLYNKRQPCTHCCLEYASDKEFTEYDHSDLTTGKHYKTSAKYINWSGKPTFAEFTIDNTEIINLQRQLLSSKSTLEAASRKLGIAFWYYDIDTQTTEWGDFLHAELPDLPPVLHNTLSSIIHQSIIHPNDIDVFTEMFNKLEENAETCDCIVRFINKNNGNYNYYHTIYTRLHDSFSKTRHAIGLSVNVDLQMSIESQYKKERLMRTQFLKDALLYYELDFTNGSIIEVHSKLNDANSINSGDKITVELRMKMLEHVYEADKEYVRHHLFSDIMTNPDNQNILTNEIIFRRYMSDNSLHWIKASITLMREPTTMQTTGFIYLHDIDKVETNRITIASIIKRYANSFATVDIQTGHVQFVSTQNEFEKKQTEKPFSIEDYFYMPQTEKCIESDFEKCHSFFTIDNLVKKLTDTSLTTLAYTVEDENGTKKRKSAIAYYMDDNHTKIVIGKRDISEK